MLGDWRDSCSANKTDDTLRTKGERHDEKDQSRTSEIKGRYKRGSQTAASSNEAEPCRPDRKREEQKRQDLLRQQKEKEKNKSFSELLDESHLDWRKYKS
nr:DUF3886 domain-containing protein [Bacillus pumilus]